ncbi:ent-kaurenoic acid oxidase 2-like [Henckelia pumila]|uniref:ent-kaurenoic acid oxidase 2-like n=1 Tax=Henckelia pumila TaxID=405737 RepID=UPI003C6EA2C7
MGWPFLGELPTLLWYFKFLRRPDEYIDSKRRKYGEGEGLYRTHLFGSPAIIACSPRAIKLVLQSDENFYQEWPTFQLMGATSMVSVHGEAHKRVRSFVVGAINNPNSLRRIALRIQPRLISALDSWAQTGRITVYKEVKKVTLENMAKYFASFESEPFLDTLDELYQGMVDGFRANPVNFPGTVYHRALRCRRKLMAIFKEELENRKKHPNEAKKDVMEGLREIKDEEGNQLSDIEVVDNIVSLLVGGYESTVLATMWAFYYLAKYPHVLQNLRDEHSNIMSKKQVGDFITYDEISTCEYTSKVVAETIRLANISAFVFRTASKDVEYKGYIIPKGWRVMCWLRYVHTDSENFENPFCFNPERWNVPPKASTNLVFGKGTRTCAGNKLAQLQLSIILHHLAMGYKWELVNPEAKIIYLPHPKPEDRVVIDFCKI